MEDKESCAGCAALEERVKQLEQQLDKLATRVADLERAADRRQSYELEQKERHQDG